MKTSRAQLSSLRAPVERELKTFQTLFKDALRSRVGLLDVITRYLVRQKGKRVRPLLVLLSAKACGGVTERTFRGATLIEILHTATLVHDDVVDEADSRRGFASINAVWKNKVGVLLGDFLLARGLLLAIEHDDHDFLRSTSTAVKRMSEGELLQIQKSRQLDIDESTYLRIIGDKTASLFATCTEIGALSASTSRSDAELLRNYGEQVGLAFQIRDDLMDYLGKRSVIGKPTGIDLKEKKLTLPLIYALRTGLRRDAVRALKMIKAGARSKDIAWVLSFVEASGGIDYAASVARSFGEKARTSIAHLPASTARRALEDFVDFVVQRDS
jgi:octaprenyl-diphosphate synthase